MTETLADMGSSMKVAVQKLREPAESDQATRSGLGLEAPFTIRPAVELAASYVIHQLAVILFSRIELAPTCIQSPPPVYGLE